MTLVLRTDLRGIRGCSRIGCLKHRLILSWTFAPLQSLTHGRPSREATSLMRFFVPFDASGIRKRPTPGLPYPAVQRLQAFSASWRVAPPDTLPALFHAGGAYGVLPSEVFPPMPPIEPLGRSAPPDVVLQVGRSASSPVVVRKRATSFLEVTLSVRRRSGAFRRQKLRTGNAVPALGLSVQFPPAPCGTCGDRAASPVATLACVLTTPS